jgi:hypothetical protein
VEFLESATCRLHPLPCASFQSSLYSKTSERSIYLGSTGLSSAGRVESELDR